MIKTLLKKEFFELLKTKKIIILPLIFIVIATMSVFLGRYMMEIFKNVTTEGFNITPQRDPIIYDAYDQFSKNLLQMGYIVLLFISTHLFISDKTKGRLIMLISKPMNRTDILYSKFLTIVIQLVISLILAGFFFIFYTMALFENETLNISHFLGFISLFFVYGLFLVSLTMFASTITKTYMSSIMVSIGFFFISSLFSMGNLDVFYLLPSKSSSIALSIVNNTMDTKLLIINLASNILLSILLIFLSIKIFKNQEIE